MKNSTNSLIDILEHETSRLDLMLDNNQKKLFEEYASLLLEWNQRASITNITDSNLIAKRLFAESLSLLVILQKNNFFSNEQMVNVADIGSGGGFPGIPMYIIAPQMKLSLIEVHQRRSEFLNHVVNKLRLDNVQVISERIENVGRNSKFRESFDLVVARALAPLNVLTEYALPLTRLNGILATPKGSKVQEEIANAKNANMTSNLILPEPD